MTLNTNQLTRQSWNRIRQIVRRRDNETCQYCGKLAPDGEPDHILPLEQGGRDSLDNLVWTCIDCNREKQSKTLRQWIKHIQREYSKRSSTITQRTRTDSSKCSDWLLVFLEENGGSVAASELRRVAFQEGYTMGALRRAKELVNSDIGLPSIISRRKGRHWFWELQGGSQAEALAMPEEPGRSKSVDWLLTFLRDNGGSVAATDLYKAAHQVGSSRGVIRNAKAVINADPELPTIALWRDGQRWMWDLEEDQ